MDQFNFYYACEKGSLFSVANAWLYKKINIIDIGEGFEIAKRNRRFEICY